MRVAIHQPNFFPRIKVLQKIARSDLWVVLDDVQFMRRDWQNRTILRHYKHRDHDIRITIPVTQPNGRSSRIDEIVISPSYSEDKAICSFRHLYQKAPYWKILEPLLLKALSRKKSLVDMDMVSTLSIFELLEIPINSIRSSQIRVTSTKSQRLLDICQHVGATSYISGSGGRNYLNEDVFMHEGISVEWQRWSDTHWRDVSYIDFLALYGPQALGEFITNWPQFELDN